MDSNQFDALVSRVSPHLTRRRSVGVLATFGLAGASLVPAADARKKKKKGRKKRKCPTCPSCQQCKSGRCVVASDGTACGAGNLCDSGTCRAARCGDPGMDCRIFITSQTFTGNLGGLAGADAKCQLLADAAGVEGTYMAWLSDSSASPATRFPTKSSGRYILLNGTTVANNWADLTDGQLATTFTVTNVRDEGVPGPGEHTWTGTRITGEGIGRWCQDWTSATSTDRGLTGYHRYANREPSFSDNWTEYDEYPCNASLRLYCVQQS